MKRLGLDIGTSTIKLVVFEDGLITKRSIKKHYGKVLSVLKNMLEETLINPDERVAMCVTGSNAQALLSVEDEIPYLGYIPAVTEGVKRQIPNVGCVIEIGSQGARFITNLENQAPEFAVNEHCAGGTGSFFEDQMSRLGLKIEDYSTLVKKAQSVPRLSGRCAVFAKTDIIHRQQEGVSTPDILLGLCYALVRNYKATIVKNLPIKKPIVFCGGVTQNEGMEKAIRDVFELQEDELIVPDDALFTAAIGSAIHASGRLEADGCCDLKRAERDSDYSEEMLFCYSELEDKLKEAESKRQCAKSLLPKLVLAEGTNLNDPEVTGVIPDDGCTLGIDIGSTSTDLVMTDRKGNIIDFQYLRTAGDPEGVVRKGLASIKDRFGEVKFTAVGITGSGRERIGRMMGADAIRDEITAQAKAAVHWNPKADTVFEIGGQDSKFISLKDGEVSDFMMNKICAAGTGSFVEEQAARMEIPIEKFGPLALTSENPSELGERCTVFIETAIASAEASGASQADIAAGLCHAIVRNYLHKVVGSKKVGDNIVLQGGVDYNPGIVAAFQSAYGDKVSVSPVFSISGAYGASLLAYESVGVTVGEDSEPNRESTFLGFDFPSKEIKKEDISEEIRKNKELYKMAGQFSMRGYDAEIDPNKKTIGIPMVLVMFKFFTLANSFFRDLGFNVVMSHVSNEETIQLSQQYAQGETCYPVKLIYGHMMQLANQNVDYIFLPNIHTIKHPHAHAAHNYACPYMQTAAKSIFDSLHFADKGIKLLNPVFDLDLGAKAMAKAMVGVGQSLGFSVPRCAKAMVKGGMAVQKNMEDTEKLGNEIISNLKPEDKVLVIITRNYGYADPVLNMGIPNILLSKGYKVMTLGYIPGMSLDISEDYPNMYWPFGDHLLAGAKLVANHPNLYAVYLTNHGCGPDTLVNHMFREEMGDKLYLQIEVDEQYSAVGIITRIEAFLNSISHRPPAELPENFNILNVKKKKANIKYKADKNKKLYIPNLGVYSWLISAYFEKCGYTVSVMNEFSRELLMKGRAETTTKEYLPFSVLLGEILETIEKESKNISSVQFLIPYNEGADADGQYARAIRTVLDRKGYQDVDIIAPILECLPIEADDPDLLMRALVLGDVLYSAPSEKRDYHYCNAISDWQSVISLAREIGKISISDKTLGIVGTPMSMTSIDEGILERLEYEGETFHRAPLSEMMWFLWKDNSNNSAMREFLAKWEKCMNEVHVTLNSRSSFEDDFNKLFEVANKYISNYSGANGRYRYAKAVLLSEKCNAIINMSPRYENTAMVLNMRNLHDNCKVPVYDLSLDGDFDESGWERLRSFLYYC